MDRSKMRSSVRRIEERTGLNVDSEVIPVYSSIAFTIGGAPIDDEGRVTFNSQKMWYTGLYAAELKLVMDKFQLVE